LRPCRSWAGGKPGTIKRFDGSLRATDSGHPLDASAGDGAPGQAHDADPLRPHSELLAGKLRTQGAEPETLFFPVGYQPPLGHEYQFDLDTDAGQLFLERLLTFLRQRLAVPPQSLGTDPARRPGTAP